MVTNYLAKLKVKKPYSHPKLTEYGDVRSLTKSATSGGNECGNQGAKKVCRP